MQSILILYQGDDWKRSKPHHSDAQSFGYATWASQCKKKNIELYRATPDWFRNGRFFRSWKFTANGWEKVKKAVVPTVIYDKCSIYDQKTGAILPKVMIQKNKIETACRVVNDPEFSNLFDSKLNQALIFSQYLPKSSLVYPGQVVLKKGKSPIVLKEFYGSGGKKVVISHEAKMVAQKKLLFQEFIDASKNGVLQDVRIVFLGSKPQYALTRIAKKGSLYTNFHQGAHIEFLDLKKLSRMIALAKEIMQPLEIFPKRIFSLDFLVAQKTGRAYLVEINSMPGLDVFSEKSKKILEGYTRNLTEYLLS